MCKEDAINLCSAKGSWNDKSTDVDNSPLVLPCLYHHINVDEESNAEKTDDNKQRRVLNRAFKSSHNLTLTIINS